MHTETFFINDLIHGSIPLWIKISYTLMVLIIVPIYWRDWGPVNFLWLSDIALFTMMFALWFESSYLSSMMAVGVLPLELLWTLDFFCAGKCIGLTNYMFNPKHPFYLRALSLFHIPLTASILYMLFKFGYNPNAIYAQILLIWIVFPLTYIFADPKVENINWVFGLGDKPAKQLYPIRYLFLLLVGVTFIVYLPLHYLLKNIFA